MRSTLKYSSFMVGAASIGLLLSAATGTATAQPETFQPGYGSTPSVALTRPAGDYSYIDGKPLVMPNGAPARTVSNANQPHRAAQPYANETSCYDDYGNLRDDLTRILYNRGGSIICYANTGIESVDVGGVTSLHAGVNSGGIFANNGSQCVYQAFYAGNNYVYQTPINVCAIEITSAPGE